MEGRVWPACIINFLSNKDTLQLAAGFFIGFEESAFHAYLQWAADDKKVFAKINSLIRAILRDPFHGEGKPEPLKRNLSGYWSRRITQEHRLVYRVFPDRVVIISCKNHY